MPSATKLHRWTDLLASLLRRHYSATFDELAKDVPAYSNANQANAARMRMFERDKDELRALGIAIETITFDEGESTGYRLEKKGFYMPYLFLSTSEGGAKSEPRRIKREGYRALPSFAFLPEELEAIREAAERVRALGDPELTAYADSAIRKLACDLPIPFVEAREQPTVSFMAMERSLPVAYESAARPSSPAMLPISRSVFETINDALTRRKSVSFDYHAMGTNSVARRNVEPYGLFFLSSHWYLVGRDIDKAELRNFRLNRIHNPAVNTARQQSPDYSIPRDFSLREHARSKQAWELGDGNAEDALVDFNARTGAARAASQLGVAVEGAADRRKFTVRRIDAFARWLLSFGGEAVPVAPPALVNEFERQAHETRDIYASGK
jgi:predicted DNA-binding transcriptional regulator YafY